MIEGIVKKIMLTGIEKYAKILNQKSENIQIRISVPNGQEVQYEICENYQPKEIVTFLQIMDKKFDILGYEMLSTPYMAKSLVMYAEKENSQIENVCCFISKIPNSLGVSFFLNKKNTRNVTLSKFLTELGL